MHKCLVSHFNCAVLALACSVTALPLASAGPEDYSGQKVVRVAVSSDAELQQVLSLTDDVWTHRLRVPGLVEFRVDKQQMFDLDLLGLPYDIMIDDLQSAVERTKIRPRVASELGNYVAYPVLDNTVNEVAQRIQAIAENRPDLVEATVIGQSVEGQDIYLLKITGTNPNRAGANGADPKPGILINSGQHAREWITIPAALYLAEQLVLNYDTDPEIRAYVDQIEWYIVPLVNPDGYRYSHTNSRLWRKNRRPFGTLYGVDLNRNWNWNFGGPGADSFVSSDIYHGPEALSEPETRALDSVMSDNENLVAHIDTHSFSQLILWPFGDSNAVPAFIDDLIAAGLGMSEAMFAVHGAYYTPQQSIDLYPASGTCSDHAAGNYDLLSYTFELRDRGNFGFVLPPDQILPTAEEAFAGYMSLADYSTVRARIEPAAALPKVALAGESLVIRFSVEDGLSTADLASATFEARTDGNQTSFITADVTPRSATEFDITLPSGVCGDVIEFFVTVPDVGGGFTTYPRAGAEAPVRIAVAEFDTRFADSFSSDLGWAVTGSNVSSGFWERVVPVGSTWENGPAAPGTDAPTDADDLAYVTQNGAPGAQAGRDDIDGGPIFLTSPAVDLSGEERALLTFARWVFSAGNASSALEGLEVQLSSDNGNSWISTGFRSNDPIWRTEQVWIEEFIPLTDSVRVRFVAADNPNDSLAEAGVDDVRIQTFACSQQTLLGDMNCDGLVNSADIDPFVMALLNPADYASTYPDCDRNRADVSQDGAINSGDIDPFVMLLLN